MHDDDLIYDDTRYFRRGRPGYRPDPNRAEANAALWALVGLGFIAAVFVAVHFVLPTVNTIVTPPVVLPWAWPLL